MEDMNGPPRMDHPSRFAEEPDQLLAVRILIRKSLGNRHESRGRTDAENDKYLDIWTSLFFPLPFVFLLTPNSGRSILDI